ncbi:MAG: heavy metal-binding domain-containing protein [Thermodesulfobacteriota bacterium]
MIDLIIFISLIALGYFAGSRAEKQHYRSINKREEEFLYMPALTLKNVTNQGEIAQSKLVTGSVVISVDYFKRILAGLRAIVGGRVKSYETLLDRARREAVLRMKEQVRSADMILNLRIETSSISKGRRRKSVGTVEVLAYGTAIKLKK